MPIQTIAGRTAWRLAASNRQRRWNNSADAYANTIFDIKYTPKFTIDRTDRFFCIGSCFARNIEEHLLYRGIDVLSLGLLSPASEWNGRPIGILNKFTTHSMRNEILWAKQVPAYDEDYFCLEGEHWHDLQLAPGAGAVPLERALQRRFNISQNYFARIRDADVIVVTLGLNEVWRDEQSGVYMNCSPPMKLIAEDNDRYSLCVTSVSENVEALLEIRAAVMGMNPQARFVLTISPVPLGATFTGQDAAVANMRSKSVLRSAADEVCSAFPNIDYFPSYEMVALAPRALAYGDDCLHVADAVVGEVIATFLSAHGLPSEPIEPDFSEVAYYVANPDVLESVRRNEFSSGLAHWRSAGRAEGRKLRPPDGSNQIMRLLKI